MAPSGSAAGAPDARDDDPLGARDARRGFEQQVERALLPYATERLGRPPSADERQRLVDALASVRRAARGDARERIDPDDPESIARARERTAAIVAADRTFRDVLGVGLSEALRALDPGHVEDLAPPAR